MKPHLLAWILVFTLACSASSAVPTLATTPRPAAEPTPVMMIVAAEQALWVRDAPSGQKLYTLKHGKQIEIYLECGVRVEGDTFWVSISPDCGEWVARRYLKKIDAK